jgi:hypothetical protein
MRLTGGLERPDASSKTKTSRVASYFPPQGGGGRRHLLRSRPNPAETARKRAGVVRGRSPAGLLVPAHGAGRKEILGGSREEVQ